MLKTGPYPALRADIPAADEAITVTQATMCFKTRCWTNRVQSLPFGEPCAAQSSTLLRQVVSLRLLRSQTITWTSSCFSFLIIFGKNQAKRETQSHKMRFRWISSFSRGFNSILRTTLIWDMLGYLLWLCIILSEEFPVWVGNLGPWLHITPTLRRFPQKNPPKWKASNGHPTLW